MNARDEKILQLYRSGLLLKAIAAEVGMAPNSVGVVLKRLGVERPAKPQKRWGGRPDVTEQIRKLWQDGLCASQITDRLDCDRSTVDQALIDMRKGKSPRHRYDGGAPGGSGRSGFAGNMARKT